MFAWMTLLGYRGAETVRRAPKVQRKPTFTEVHLKGAQCVVLGCTKNALYDKPNAWVCWEHDREAFPIRVQQQEVQ